MKNSKLSIKNKIKCIVLALALHMSFFTTTLPMEPQPRISMCQRILNVALATAIYYSAIYTDNLLTACPSLPEGFQPTAGTSVQIAKPSLKPHLPNFIYPEYDPATMEVPRYGRDMWGNCVLATTYKDKKRA